MRLFSFLLAAVLLLAALPGCRVLAGIAAGPIMGGPSLTGRFYRQNVPDYLKVIGTPFVFLTGTTIGPLVTMARGANRELTRFGYGGDAEDYWYILDPFDAGLFTSPPTASEPAFRRKGQRSGS